MMNHYRGPEPYPANRFFFGAPLLGGFVGGLLGGGIANAFLRPRPYYPGYPPRPYPYGAGPYGGYGGYPGYPPGPGPYGGYGVPYR
ncbi:hypothetical protein [Bacillus niameyensis]|uniref:hypothetical protein n=1 Tax=Bacillus niameyensis TaxID=1522308 RepID=UPI000A6D352A